MSQFAKHATAPVDTSDPWSDDVLKRRGLAEQLTTALSTVSQPFVLGLHGEFGNGKTFFIKRWQQVLLNAGDVAVYFNAWETDYAAEPLIAFTAAIKRQLEDNNLGVGREAAKALAISAGRIVLKTVLPRAISLATGGLIQASDVCALTAIADQAAGAASDITTQTIEEAVKHHEEARDEVAQFRSILTCCAQVINEREPGSVRKLIVFVDELDRCRPDYAVHVLECIKHFFAVENVIFVIAIDRNALTESIRSVYGAGIDVDGYLRKFFDYHVELPPPLYEGFAELLAQSLRLQEALPNRLNDWLRLFPVWARAFNLSLRVQEQIWSQANFIVRSYGTNKMWMIYDLILFLLCIRAKDVGLFNRISSGKLELEVLLSEAERLIDAELGDDDRMLEYGIVILLGGFVSPEDIRAKHQAIATRLEARRSETPAAEDRNVQRQMRALGQAFEVAEQRHAGSLGRGVARRIRFLTD